MPKITIVIYLLFSAIASRAQQLPVIKPEKLNIPLNYLGRDDRFEKFIINMPVFLTLVDTILTFDFENLFPPKRIPIIKPQGYGAYGYSFIFFAGNNNLRNPGFVSVLIGNVFDHRPHLYIDRNNNFDFTDDGDYVLLPWSKRDSILIKLNRSDDSLASVSIKLRRLDYSSQPALKKMMNDYYKYFYKDRELAGIEYCYREQHYITRYGIARINNDSFKVALYDGNSNGYFNEPDSDKVIIANYSDSMFDSRDELFSYPVKKNKMVVEFNGEQFQVSHIDKRGNSIELIPIHEDLLLGKVAAGKKIPKFRFTTWNGEIKKIKKFRRYDVLLYFTGPGVKNFTKDTTQLRIIADAYPDKLKVIALMEVNKKYELKIFGEYSNLNYVAGFRERDVVNMLAIRGLPSGLWLTKRRKVVKYNVKPEDFLKEFELRYHKNK